MRFTFHYRNYPMSQKLTQKSRMIGTLTHPVMAFMIMGVFIVAGSYLFNSKEMVTPLMIASMCVLVLSLILLPKYRKKRFAQLDEEYRKLLESMK